MIVVAGGTGRLGSLVVDRLVAAGHQVRVVSRSAGASQAGGRPGVEMVQADVRDAAAVRGACEGARVVVSAVHGFTGTKGNSPVTIDRDGNRHLTDAAAHAGARLVLVSVVGAAGDAPMELFRMKYAAERYAATSGVPMTVVRATAFLETWIELLRATSGRSGRPVVFGRGDNPINFVSAADVAALTARVVTEPVPADGPLEIGGPENLTFNQLAAMVQAAVAARVGGAPRHVPRLALRLMRDVAGRVHPVARRRGEAALAMDCIDLTFDGPGARAVYPDLPCTTAADVLAAPPRPARSSTR